MKKFLIVAVFMFTAMSFTNVNYTKDKQDDLYKIENTQYPDCWAGANAAEIHSCGHIGCDFGLWSAVYSACMGYEL